MSVPLLVLSKNVRREKSNNCPAEIKTLYTINYGENWMTKPEFEKWKIERLNINVLNYYGYQRDHHGQN